MSLNQSYRNKIKEQAETKRARDNLNVASIEINRKEVDKSIYLARYDD